MKYKITISILSILIFCFSCVKDKEFQTPKNNCTEDLIANTSFTEIKALYQDQIIQIQEDLIIEGYVISSDKAGNFFGTLYLQDKAHNPTEGLQMEVELYDSYLFYQEGSKVYIKLKGLFLGKNKGNYKLGGTFTAFGSTSVGRLPASKINEHIILSCEEQSSLQPTLINITDLSEAPNNTLVRINNTEFIDEELELNYAETEETTVRTLKDCEGNLLPLVNSGYANFQGDKIPGGNGAVIGVLTSENETKYLIIRDVEDLDFKGERCPELVTEFTSTSIFISEIADPNNNSKARFVELYNAGAEPLDLNQWKLKRYTNASAKVSSEVALTGLQIQEESTVVIAANAEEFEMVYGFSPDLEAGSNSPADSNGDDNLVLVDPFGAIIDVFGVIGEDGTGTNHEFEDGRAVRKPEIQHANSTYNFTEWVIFNDSGEANTTNAPQNAPEDFTPGLR